MSLDAASPARTEGNAVRASLAWARRGSLAVLALLVAEFGIGMYVNLYVTIPNADQGGGLGSAIANGPAMLSIHAVIGMLLGLGAIGVLVQAFMSRHLGAMALSAAGLLALGLAFGTGASFVLGGLAGDSMGMAVFTGVGLLCYAANLYFLRPSREDGEPVGTGRGGW